MNVSTMVAVKAQTLAYHDKYEQLPTYHFSPLASTIFISGIVLTIAIVISIYRRRRK